MAFSHQIHRVIAGYAAMIGFCVIRGSTYSMLGLQKQGATIPSYDLPKHPAVP